MKQLYLFIITALAFLPEFQSQVVTFNYTGGSQNYTVPAGCYSICVDIRGARGRGNTNNNANGGLGGRVQATFTVSPGQVLRINVGGGGTNGSAGGFNGGAAGGTACAQAYGGGGGGASDIRVSPYGLANRIIVAGGGGGTGGDRIAGCGPGAGGGGGGGYYGGGGGGAYGGMPGQGGTQSAGGAGGTSCCGCPNSPQPGAAGTFGNGGAGGSVGLNNQAGPNPGCAGGSGGGTIGGTGANCTGGGGCPSTWAGASGGGGSSYTGAGVTGVTHTQGFQSGNGAVTFSLNCSSLPVGLMSFNAEYYQSSKEVRVTWSTASEKNNKSFTVERSPDGEVWHGIATLAGAGNSSKTLYYSHNDKFPLRGQSFYRLRQTDIDGYETFASVTAVFVPEEFTASIFPNPSQLDPTLQYTSVSKLPVNVEISDVWHKQVATFLFSEVKEGKNEFELKTSELSPGVYFIQVSNGNQVSRLKLVKH